MSRPLVIGNWKMNGSLAANRTFFNRLLSQTISAASEVCICAPYVYLAQLQQNFLNSGIQIGAQDISIHGQGAFTGEVSGEMLKDFDCKYVIVGHSERRQYHRESNELIGKKALAALESQLTPVICVGETLSERENNETLIVIKQQINQIQQLLTTTQIKQVIFAYEPIWAIGTGKTASPEQAQAVHAFIRKELGPQGKKIKLLYGGSVNEKNAQALFSQADIDGGLVGGASIDGYQFLNIINTVVTKPQSLLFDDVSDIQPGVVNGHDAKRLMDFAKHNGFAYPAVNVINTNSINAVLETAADVGSPVILQLSYSGASFFLGKGIRVESHEGHGSSVIGAVAAAGYIHKVANYYGIPVILHTDHAAKRLLPWIDGILDFSEKYHRETGQALFSSHMLDLSEETLNDNITISCQYLERMKKIDVGIEIELGCTGGEEDGVDNTHLESSELYTQPEDVAFAYNELSKISNNFSVAASFGNVHGVYQPGNVQLTPEILKHSQQFIQEKYQTEDKPVNFVFHGGSGSSIEDIKASINYGVVKMNIDTDVQWANWDGIRQYYLEKQDFLQSQIGNPDGISQPNKKYYDPRVWLRQGEESILIDLKEYFVKLDCVNRYTGAK